MAVQLFDAIAGSRRTQREKHVLLMIAHHINYTEYDLYLKGERSLPGSIVGQRTLALELSMSKQGLANILAPLEEAGIVVILDPGSSRVPQTMGIVVERLAVPADRGPRHRPPVRVPRHGTREAKPRVPRHGTRTPVSRPMAESFASHKNVFASHGTYVRVPCHGTEPVLTVEPEETERTERFGAVAPCALSEQENEKAKDQTPNPTQTEASTMTPLQALLENFKRDNPKMAAEVEQRLKAKGIDPAVGEPVATESEIEAYRERQRQRAGKR